MSKIQIKRNCNMELITDNELSNSQKSISHKKSWLVRTMNYLIFSDGSIWDNNLNIVSNLNFPDTDDDDDGNGNIDEISALFNEGAYLYVYRANTFLKIGLEDLKLQGQYRINTDGDLKTLVSMEEGKLLIVHVRKNKKILIEKVMLGTISWRNFEEKRESKSGLSSGQTAAITCAVLLFAGICTAASLFVYRHRDKSMMKSNIQVTEFGSGEGGSNRTEVKMNGSNEGIVNSSYDNTDQTGPFGATSSRNKMSQLYDIKEPSPKRGFPGYVQCVDDTPPVRINSIT
ncbi:DgyrCDS8244 [Dimorphilus gyrociliatus]|nr:DgyrCDS8244 [Dimorphilus gyrociliatus]